jgi:hypothetical protein
MTGQLGIRAMLYLCRWVDEYLDMKGVQNDISGIRW